MEKEFVPYELALKMMQLGFKNRCFARHFKGEIAISVPYHFKDDDDIVNIPTFSQAFRWFREKYGLYSWVKLHNGYTDDSFYEKLPITWTIMEHESGKQHYEKDTDNYLYHTHEEAELACLKKLIEIKENE